MQNRWIVLVSGLIVQTILGGIYAWSSLTPWLADQYGISNGESGFIFGLSIAVFTLVMVGSGRLMAHKGPRIPALIGASLYLLGYLAASFFHGSYMILLLSIALVAGAGIGFCYVVPLAVGMQWFPNHKGLITGLSVGGFGGGAMILSNLIEAAKHSGLSIDRYFLIYSLIAGLILLFCALMLVSPKKKATQASVKLSDSAQTHLTRTMVKSIIGMFSGTFAGLLLIGNLVPYTLVRGIAEQYTTVAVMLFSLGNLTGRIVWGHLFDRMGESLLSWALLLGSLFFIALLFVPEGILYFAIISVLGFLFGSQFVLYAGMLSKKFGVTQFSRYYPLVFLSYGFAGIVAPGFGGWVADFSGSYNSALMVCIILLLGAGLYFSFAKTSE